MTRDLGGGSAPGLAFEFPASTPSSPSRPSASGQSWFWSTDSRHFTRRGAPVGFFSLSFSARANADDCRRNCAISARTMSNRAER